MKKIILGLFFIPLFCFGQWEAHRQRLNIMEKAINPAKQALNNLMLDLEHLLTEAAQQVGVLRRSINYLESQKSIKNFKDDLQSACNKIRDRINTTLPRSAEMLNDIYED